MQIGSTEHLGQGPLKVLIYGPSGAGKTTLIGTLKDKVLVVSAESGLLPLRGKKIDVVDISRDDKGDLIAPEKRIDRLAEVYTYLLTEEARKKYDTICVDSLTELSQCLFAKLNQQFPDRSSSLVLYGENAKQLRKIVKMFRDLPHYSVIFSALSVVEKDPEGLRYSTVDLVGGFASKLPAYLDEVYFLHVDKDGVRSLITSSTDKLVAKSRAGTLNKSEPADLGVIFGKIRGMAEDKGLALRSEQPGKS